MAIIAPRRSRFIAGTRDWLGRTFVVGLRMGMIGLGVLIAVPLVIGLLLLLFALRLPHVIGHVNRRMDWVPVLACPYFFVVLPILGFWLGTPIFMGVLCLFGLAMSLPPDPYTFFFRPEQRRAVFLVARHIEAQDEGDRLFYSGFLVVEASRRAVIVRAVMSSSISGRQVHLFSVTGNEVTEYARGRPSDRDPHEDRGFA